MFRGANAKQMIDLNGTGRWGGGVGGHYEPIYGLVCSSAVDCITLLLGVPRPAVLWQKFQTVTPESVSSQALIPPQVLWRCGHR